MEEAKLSGLTDADPHPYGDEPRVEAILTRRGVSLDMWWEIVGIAKREHSENCPRDWWPYRYNSGWDFLK